MVTSNAPTATDAEAAKKKADRRAARRAGKEAGDKAENKGENKGRKSLTLAHIGKRIEAIKKLEDASKAKRASQRLAIHVLTGIADGSVTKQVKAAQAVVAILPKKAEGKGGAKGKAGAKDEDQGDDE